MSDRRFERAVLDWLEDGSDRTPRRAIDAVLLAVKTTPQERGLRPPWRFTFMTNTMRAAAGIALVAVIAVGALAVGAGVGGPSPSPSPTATVTPTPSTGPFSFTSPLYGYSVTVPAGWRVTPSTAAWRPGARPTFDVFAAPVSQGDEYDDVSIAAQPVPDGMTPKDWLLAFAQAQEASSRTCKGPADDWTDAFVGSLAIRRLDLRCTGVGYDLRLLDVAFVVDGTGYVMSGNPTVIGQFLEEFQPGAPAPTEAARGITPLTTYTSAIYGTTLSYPADWSVKARAARKTQSGDAFPANELPYADTFASPGEAGAQVGLIVWQTHIDVFTGTADLKALAGKFCVEVVASSCETFTQRAVPLDFNNGGDGGCAILVPTADRQYAFLSDQSSCAITEGTSWITVVVIDREDEFPSAARYGGSVELLRSIVATMKVWRPAQ
jgi:hypothetical protein